MSEGKVGSEAYIQILLASPRVYSCVEAARVQANRKDGKAHDAYTRLLQRLEPETAQLWQESEAHVKQGSGVLILDDSTLDKPDARKMELVGYQWSGKHQRVVKGMNLVTLLWSDGESHILCDHQLYDQSDGLSKNGHFQAMLTAAYQRGFRPNLVLFVSWYSGLTSLKYIHAYGWYFLTQLKQNRLVNSDGSGLVPISTLTVPDTGIVVHLKGFGHICLFELVATNGNIEFWATNRLDLHPLACLRYSGNAWVIEAFHRGLKQFCGVQAASVRSARGQHNYIRFAICAFLRLELHALRFGRSWFELKFYIIRSALRSYLLNPSLLLPSA